jgi:hypothetical protein
MSEPAFEGQAFEPELAAESVADKAGGEWGQGGFEQASGPLPTEQEWNAAREQIAYYEGLVAEQQAQATEEEMAEIVGDLQERFLMGDPGALELMNEVMTAQVAQQIAPVAASIEAMLARQEEQGLAAAETEARGLIDSHLKELGSEPANREMVWTRANEIVSETFAAAEAAGLSYTPEERRSFGLAELRRAAEEVHEQTRPYGNVPHAVTNRMFGRAAAAARSTGSSSKGSGLGNVPHAVSSRWFRQF